MLYHLQFGTQLLQSIGNARRTGTSGVFRGSPFDPALRGRGFGPAVYRHNRNGRWLNGSFDGVACPRQRPYRSRACSNAVGKRVKSPESAADTQMSNTTTTTRRKPMMADKTAIRIKAGSGSR
jgi:hypothetical protein